MMTIEGLPDLAKAIKNVEKRLDDKSIKKVLRRAAKPYRLRAKATAPKASTVVKRYSTAKVDRSMRAPKGRGTVVATYTPGNLSRSMKNLPLRRATRSVIVGPKRGNSKGTFAGSRVDGWYAHMIERGTKHFAARPFIEPSWMATKQQVEGIALREFKDIVLK